MYNQLAYFLSHYYLLSDEGPTLETLDFTIHNGSTPTFLYFDLYFNTADCLRSTRRLSHLSCIETVPLPIEERKWEDKQANFDIEQTSVSHDLYTSVQSKGICQFVG